MADRPRQALALLGWLALCFLAALVGNIASTEAPQFYAQLQQPEWAPPAWLFGPVWTALYILMALAAWLVWRERGLSNALSAFSLFVIQLAVNAAWSWVFFVLQLGGLAFFWIVGLMVLIIATMELFHRVRMLAAILLVPYLLWVIFAGMLTYTLWTTNPSLL